MLAVLALPAAWLAAALIFGLIPANPGWREPTRGVTIFVRTNGVHTWLVLPKRTRTIDWRSLARAEHLADPRLGAAAHVAFGYGNREFYLNTPRWADLSAKTAFLAALGNGAPLLHVEHDLAPRNDPWTRPIRLRKAEYARLAEYIRRRFRLDAEGRSLPLTGRGYGEADVFYEAEGGYSAIFTCNEWTGRALRHAGVRMGLWTPLAQSLTWRLDARRHDG